MTNPDDVLSPDPISLLSAAWSVADRRPRPRPVRYAKPGDSRGRPPLLKPRSPSPDPQEQGEPPQTEVWQLIRMAQAGDGEAFGQLYDRYKVTVFRFVYYRVNGDRQLAEDLTADTFMRAIKKLGSFTWQGRDLGAWLVTIARNIIADHFKSSRVRLEVPTGDMRADVEARSSRGHQESPESAALDGITSRTLVGAIEQLSREQQECIVLRFIQGFSVGETAKAMDKTEGAVKALQYRGVRALARLLPKELRP